MILGMDVPVVLAFASHIDSLLGRFHSMPVSFFHDCSDISQIPYFALDFAHSEGYLQKLWPCHTLPCLPGFSPKTRLKISIPTAVPASYRWQQALSLASEFARRPTLLKYHYIRHLSVSYTWTCHMCGPDKTWDTSKYISYYFPTKYVVSI